MTRRGPEFRGLFLVALVATACGSSGSGGAFPADGGQSGGSTASGGTGAVATGGNGGTGAVATGGVSGTVASGGSGGAPLCVPGQQIPCACGGGEQGYQVCKPDGSGFDACVCPDGGTGGSGVGGAASGGGGSGGTGGCAPGATFECGPTLICTAPYEYCLVTQMATTSYACQQDVLDCGCTVTCSCVPQLLNCTQQTCTDTSGAITVLCT